MMYVSTKRLTALQIHDGRAGTWAYSSASGKFIPHRLRVNLSGHSCSGIHRGMGTHISRVKSVDLDAWTDEQLQSVLRWGNTRANKLAAGFEWGYLELIAV